MHVAADLDACERTARDLREVAERLSAADEVTARTSRAADAWSDGFLGQAAEVHRDRCRVLSADLGAEAEAVRGVAASLQALVVDLEEVEDLYRRATASDDPLEAGDLEEVARRRESEVGAAWVDALWRYEHGLSAAPPIPPPLAPPAWSPPPIDVDGDQPPRPVVPQDVVPDEPTPDQPAPDQPAPVEPAPDGAAAGGSAGSAPAAETPPPGPSGVPRRRDPAAEPGLSDLGATPWRPAIHPVEPDTPWLTSLGDG